MIGFTKKDILNTNDPTDCKDCLHQTVCQYKESRIDIEDAITNIIAEAKDASFLEITTKCAYKDSLPH